MVVKSAKKPGVRKILKKTNGGVTHQTRANQAVLANNQERAYEYKLAGWTLRQIAAEMGVGHNTVKRWIDRAIDERISPKVEQYRTMQLDRIEKYLAALDGKVETGDDRAISTALRALERQAKLLGMDAPTQTQGEVTVVLPRPEVADRIAMLRLKVEQTEAALKAGQNDG